MPAVGPSGRALRLRQGRAVCRPCARPLSLPWGRGARVRCWELAPVGCVSAEGFWWHACAVLSVPDHARGQGEVGISLPTCRWAWGCLLPLVKSRFSSRILWGISRPGLRLVPMGLWGSAWAHLHRCVTCSPFPGSSCHAYLFSLSLQALWKTGSRGVRSPCPCPIQDRRVAKSEDRSGPGSLPLPPECRRPGRLLAVESLFSLVTCGEVS